jgi:chemotaxis response regulator CheB
MIYGMLNTLTAGTGATLRELMDRMGHSSTGAALIHRHGSDARQRQIANSLNRLAEREFKSARSGTQRVRAYGAPGVQSDGHDQELR